MDLPNPHRLYVHIAWATLGRVPTLEPRRRAAIESHVLASCRWIGADPVEVCALPDRVHLLSGVPAVLSVAALAAHVRDAVEEMLAETGRVVRWSGGFAAATVSPADVRRIRRLLAELEPRAPPGTGAARRRASPRRATGG